MKKATAIILSIFAAAAIVGGVILWNYLRDNKLPAFAQTTELYVYPDTPVQSVIDSLIVNGAPKWPQRLSKVFADHSVETGMKPGHYVVPAGQPAVYVARMLNNGWQTPVKMTLSGTLRLRGEIARKISSQMMVDSASVRAAFEDKEMLAGFGFTPETVFAMLIPDTYEMYWTDDVKTIFARQKKAYDAFWTPENEAKAKSLGLSKMQVSIVASIVSGESNHVPEFNKIAGVYLNRLNKGMKLQADPTIAFCYGYTVRRIYRNMLSFESPYNTYKYAGLPPGPIYVPTKNTLNAVLNPDFGGGNLFFCADPSFNGSHRFAKTYGEHLQNARAFQKALNIRMAEKKKANE